MTTPIWVMHDWIGEGDYGGLDNTTPGRMGTDTRKWLWNSISSPNHNYRHKDCYVRGADYTLIGRRDTIAYQEKEIDRMHAAGVKIRSCVFLGGEEGSFENPDNNDPTPFDWIGDNALSILHRQCSNKHKVPWCYNYLCGGYETPVRGSTTGWATLVKPYIAEGCTDSAYAWVNVSGTMRPLVFLLLVEGLTTSWSTLANAKTNFIDPLRAAILASTGADPYLVSCGVSTFQPGGSPVSAINTLGMDAFGYYTSGPTESGQSYDSFADALAGDWDTVRTTIAAGKHTVPGVSGGVDPRTYSDYGGIVGSYNPPGAGQVDPGQDFCYRPTKQQLAERHGEARDWIAAHPEANPVGLYTTYSYGESLECANALGSTLDAGSEYMLEIAEYNNHHRADRSRLYRRGYTPTN